MQGSGRYKPQAAVEISTSDEASHLTLYLQKQLEDDIARIFDESIYPDLELVCGKLKILTHACILKTRSSKFYDKFESFLHVNIDRKLFDEIYSFISDSYTECDIKRQEREILSYLEKNFVSPYSSNKATEEHELFLTPKCLSPSSKRINEQKSLSSSPSIELTKEYYSLVPIEGNILDKELIEQDVLSNAFQSIQKNETEYSKTFNKPTTLPLGTNLACKSVKHSNSCDSLTKILSEVKTKNGKGSNVNSRIYDVPDLLKKASGVLSHRIIESKISPDSLVTDDPSSSSDYLSAANASPGFVIAHSDCQSNVCTSKMENPFTSSDSGLEITGQHESLNSNRDTTSIDIISLTENILHESNASSLSQYTDNDSRSFETLPDIPSANTSENNQQLQLPDLARKTTKEEKQKHNEEIVTLESSSLSSEAGSWESVFPPKRTGNDSRKIPTTDLHQSPKVSKIPDTKEDPAFSNNISKSLVQKSPFKSTSCFIDAASLADEEEVMRIETDTNGFVIRDKPDTLQLNPSQPVPCSTFKHTISPQEKSECNDNDDSLEQTDNKDPESIQKDLSPTIFEMTPITEDSLCSNVFEAIAQEEQNKHDVDTTSVSHKPPPTVLPYTPYNSILSVNPGAKQYDSESETDTIRTTESEDTTTISVRRNRKTPDSQPIVSGGASVEDHLPQVGSYSCSPAMKRKLESSLIVSGGYMSEAENLNIPKSPKPISSWIVNMSIPKVLEKDSGSEVNKRPIDKTCESLKSASKYGSNENCSKSRSSIDSDSSERSGHTFYIDLSTLPDTPVSNQLDTSLNTDKKNIFSMYIGLEDSPRLKEMPPRLLSSINNKKQTHNDTKSSGKANKKEINEQPKKIESQLTSADAFETIEMLCQDPNLNLSEIISAPTGKSKTTTKSSSNIGVKKSPGNLGQIKENVVNEEINPKESEDLFVRLSDLDKPAPKVDLFVATQGSPSTRMTRSIPDDNWNNRQKPTSRSIEVINSFHSENAESLNRLFPHLKNEFSASMPGSLSGRTKSTLKLAGDVEEPASDVSEFGSSVESSMCRSYIDSATEDTSEISTLLSSCQSRLGQELLRMFLQEIAPDVVVEVSGRRIKAHKCILASRCQYFAGILSGGWVESSGNVIVLPPFSYNVVHFALCHIYSGVSTIPDWVSIVELATIADMLGLEGLKEAIMYTLKAKYCHHFHKPCQVCTAGVLECFPLSSVYGLDDLYRKCLRWITKHFSKVWPTKAFATLPKELLDKCYQQHIVNLNLETLVSKVFGCGMILSALENCRWADSVARMCRRLLSAAAQHVAPRLVAALRAVAALPPGVGPGAAQALDDCFAAAFDWAPPDEACRAYAFLTETCTQQTLHHYQPEAIANGHPPESFDHDNLLYVRANCWRQQCEGALIRAALRVVSTQAFKVLPADLKKRLRALCCVKYGGSVPPASPHTPLQGGKNTTSKNKNTQNLIIDIVKTTFVPYSTKPVKVGSVELSKSSKDEKDMKIPKGQPPKIRMTKAQEERAKYNLLKTNQYREHTAANKLTPVKPRIDHVKAKYSQPRMNKCLEIKPPQVKKLAPKMMSSSESSRNSSPSQARKLRNCRLKSPNDTLKLQTMSQDSLATTSRPWTAEPSTDSLSESQTSNKYATYTKTKHIPDGQQSSSESVKTGQSQITSSNCNKKKSKIPVSCNHPQKNIGKQSNTTQLIKSVENISRGNKLVDRRVPASLMSATKSSSAKIVPKVMKEIAVSKSKCIKPKQNKKEVEALATTDIPVMERSGTFMKDEPTFCDKTIDIDPINGIK